MNPLNPDTFDTFTQGSLIHGLCLAVGFLLTVGTAILARRERERDRRVSRLPHLIAAGCLLSWTLSNGIEFLPGHFGWSFSLPLHFCNLANLVGAAAVLTRHRSAQSLTYFWAFGLAGWAFITPSLSSGPATLWFWLFWLYHYFILIAVTWVLVADRFRPTWSDFGKSLAITLTYMGLLVILNFFTGWNYAFVGRTIPPQATLLDFLGPYPIRLVWMALIGSAIFAMLMIPWMRKRTERPE